MTNLYVIKVFVVRPTNRTSTVQDFSKVGPVCNIGKYCKFDFLKYKKI